MTFPLPAARLWLARRLFPVLATAGLVAVGMAATTWWGSGLLGRPGVEGCRRGAGRPRPAR